jgi:DNA-directed RNA polymerase II subunit RPB1
MSIIKSISRIDFDVLSNNTIAKMSVLGNSTGAITPGVEIIELYDNGETKQGGLNDKRFGTISNETECATCGLTTSDCGGHFGHILLSEYMYNVNFLKTVYQIVSGCICPRCSKILIHKNEAVIKDIMKYKNGRERLQYVRMISKNITHCRKVDYGCGTPIPKIKLDSKKTSSAINIIAEIDIMSGKDANGFDAVKKYKYILKPEDIYNILKNISDDDCVILGFNPKRSRPEHMIHKVLPVPPLQMRPPSRVEFQGGSTSEDHITRYLIEIVKANERIKKNKENNTDNSLKINTEFIQLMQLHIATYINSDSMPKNEQKGQPLKSLKTRISGKEGRMRHNIQGKRGDYTARTVITSDPTINMNQVGVPIKIAMNLTFPEYVNEYNIEKLTELVRRGRDKYPGANYVFPNDGKSSQPVDLRYRKDKIELRIGDIVERHLQNGDVVLLNRQPTLHKQSMMAHRIKVINDEHLLSFRLSVAVTKPYNADFDGDEMNIFVPQTLQTQIELEEIACVERQIITPTTSTPIIGIVQDGLLGAYVLTDKKVNVDWRNTMNIIAYSELDDYSMFAKNNGYTGHEIFSVIIPTGIGLHTDKINIERGKLLSGRLTNKFLGPKQKNNLIQLIWDKYGAEDTKKFIDNTQKIINNYNLYNGFTVGMDDVTIIDDVKKKIDTYIETKELKIAHMITNVETNPNLMAYEIYEKNIKDELNIVEEDIGQIIMNNIKPNNNFNIMILSGSKGNSKNMGQMVGCIGLQAFQGGLIPKNYNNRSLSYYHQNDDRSASRGLIREAFSKGINFPEFNFHLLVSRSGSIDTSIKTADTGYAQRRMIKAMEDIMVKYDGTVRGANNKIIQIIYGDSGADTTKQYEYNIGFISKDNKEIENEFIFDDAELALFGSYTRDQNKKYYKLLLEMRDDIRECVSKVKNDYIALTTNFMIPVGMTRIINEIPVKNDRKHTTDMTPQYVLDQLDLLMTNKMTPISCISKNTHVLKSQDEQINKTTLKAVLHDALAPKKVLLKYKLSKEEFDNIVKVISRSYYKNIIEPGEMVGIIAAQSMGEPLTQMTLSSFHNAGVAAVASTLQGIPRVKEVLSATKLQKTPQMIIFLEDAYKTNRDLSYKIASRLKYTTLENIRERIHIYYDPVIDGTTKIMTDDNVKHIFYGRDKNKKNEGDMSNMPWLVRVEINRDEMLDKEITLLEIKSKFSNWWESRITEMKIMKKEEKKIISKISQLVVLSNSDNDIQPVLHIRFNVKDSENDVFNLETVNSFISTIIEQHILKGSVGIHDICAIPEEKEIIFNKKTGAIEHSKQFKIYTNGVNLIDIRYLVGIDLNKTICNDIMKTYQVFGIEVARAVILHELQMTYNTGGGEVNIQHISLLVDLMTATGSIVSVDRHGMPKSESDILSRASFEKITEQLAHAAAFSETDNMMSVSSRICVGSVIQGGTGYCSLELNTEMIEQSEYFGDSNNNKFTDYKSNAIAYDIFKQNDEDDIFIPE